MNTPIICKDCGYEMSWHDENGMLSSAFGGMAPCNDAIIYKTAKQNVNNKEKENVERILNGKEG